MRLYTALGGTRFLKTDLEIDDPHYKGEARPYFPFVA